MVRRGLRFRHRIGLLVLLAGTALVSVTAVTLVLGHRSEQQVAGIETRYVPLLEADRDLEMMFAQIRRALQDAAGAAEKDRLLDADALAETLVQRLRSASSTIASNGGDAEALEREFGAYYQRARSVSSRIMAGTPAAQLGTDAAAMASAQRDFARSLDAATSPDRSRLARAFTAVRRSQQLTLRIDIAVASAALALMVFLSWRLIRHTVSSLQDVALGVERLARGDFDREIVVSSGDEIGDLAAQANQTAARLREYRKQAERDDWIKTGLAELRNEIAGDLEPAALASEAMAHLVGYLGGAAAITYLRDESGDFRLLGTYRGPSAAVACSSFRSGQTQLGEIARAGDVRIVDNELGINPVPAEPPPPHVALVPLIHHGRPLGLLAVALLEPPRPRALALMTQVRAVLGTALLVAESHRQTQALLEETRRQAEQLRAAYATLAEAKERADAANRELEAFSYSVSHDLRTPLRAIDGFSQALLEVYAGQLDDKGTDYLQRVRNAAQRMGELIDALLDLSRINRGPIEREPVDLSAVARKIAEELERHEPERDVTFTIAEGLCADADLDLLRVLFENLLGNAWKFTAKTADARIQVGADARDGETVFSVRDNGAGFDMAYASKLFAPFQRLHNVSEFDGTGIGLATVQRVVERHGGRIWAEGAVGEGATIYFTLAPPATETSS